MERMCGKLQLSGKDNWFHLELELVEYRYCWGYMLCLSSCEQWVSTVIFNNTHGGKAVTSVLLYWWLNFTPTHRSNQSQHTWSEQSNIGEHRALDQLNYRHYTDYIYLKKEVYKVYDLVIHTQIV